MKWLERHYEKKKNPKKIWDKVKTIIVIGLNLDAPKDNPLKINELKNVANISVYAKNRDYHEVISKKLNLFKDWFSQRLEFDCKIFVDTVPVMEKYFAKKTQIGWLGKHTNIVSKNLDHGYFYLKFLFRLI